ncbi:MAG: NADPH-dependent glutamate synthase [Promethearchaeota archaeon]
MAEKKLDMKARAKNRAEMPCQDPAVRVNNFNEVETGLSEEQAVAEATRCLGCKKAPCITGCPVGIDIKSFLQLVADRQFRDALVVIREKNTLPGITGRVCPQESQCEIRCTLGKMKDGIPLAIGAVERFVADWNASNAGSVEIKTQPRTGKKVAVVGSGPAGLTAAGELARLGHEVTVFEAFHEPGGVLVYGIPEFRLPKQILREEVKTLELMGVKFEYDVLVGKTIEIEELFTEGFSAIFIGTGAGLPRFLRIPGEWLNDVYSANEFLTRVNLMKAYLFPEYDTPIKVGKNVAVIGGGNVAMDSARTALRLGAENVYVFYRRSLQEMPARSAEIEHAREEGIKFRFLRNPVEILGDDAGNVASIKLQVMVLGCKDGSGRASCKPVKGEFEVVDVDMVVVAIGSDVNTVCSQNTCDLEVTRRGHIIIGESTQETTLKDVFAAGDAVTGGATVISAMGSAKEAAREMHERLMKMS